jgi:predicted Zn-dependent protease
VAQENAPDRGVNFYSLEKERALGAQLAAEYRRSVTAIESAAVNAYLTDLGRRIAARAQGPDFTYTFELVDDNTLLNEAPAFPGGAIFVPAQLILAAKSEDELAGMMAHSIAHVAARHGTKQATKGATSTIGSAPLIMMAGWTGYAIRQGSALAVPLGFLQFQRASELQADSLAVQAMAAAGYNPASLADYVERTQPVDGLPAPVFRPLPDRDSRIAAIRAAIQNLPVTTFPPHDSLAAIQDEVMRLKTPIPAKTPPRLAR